MAQVDNSKNIPTQGGATTGTAGSATGFSPLDDQVDPQEYARLLDLYDSSFRNIAEGEVVKGTVLKVTPSEVIVDVGYKSEGIIAIGRVIERIKGGLAVDIGVRAFLPGSQIDVRPVRNLDALRGQELRMRVIKVNKKRGNIVLSRKALLEEENAEKKKHTLEALAEGKVLKGVVKSLTDYGAFIELEAGVEGLIHVSEMSWSKRVKHPSKILNVGDPVDAMVLGVDPA